MVMDTTIIRSQRSTQPLRHTKALWIFTASIFLLYFVGSLVRLYSGRATAWDFGYFSQVLWLISHGDWAARSTFNGHLALTDAGSAILYPIGWLYPILGSPGILMLQAVALASGLPFLAWWLRRYEVRSWMAWSVFCLYVVYPAILGPAYFDWHPDVLAIPAIFYAMWALETRRRWHFWCAAALLMTLKVTMAFVLVGLGVVWLFRREWKLGATTIMIATVVVVGEINWLFPVLIGHTMPQWTQYYGWLGPTPAAGMAFMITHPLHVLEVLATPHRGAFALGLLLPIGIVPTFSASVRSGWAWPAWFTMGFTFLSSFKGELNPWSQYSTPIVPFLFVSLVTFPWLKRLSFKWSLLAISLILLCGVTWFSAERPALWYAAAPTHGLVRASKLIPTNARLYGQNSTLARLADRRIVKLLPLPQQVAQGTMVLLTKDVNPNNTTTMAPILISRTLDRLRSHPKMWQAVFHKDHVWLFRRR